MTSVDGVFSCGNALHVNDLVDYVSESGELAGFSAAHYSPKHREAVPLKAGKNMLYIVPQLIDAVADCHETTVYFRSSGEFGKSKLVIKCGDRVIAEKKYQFLRPPEMERLTVDFGGVSGGEEITAEIEVEEK